jgi:hypothetical protein
MSENVYLFHNLTNLPLRVKSNCQFKSFNNKIYKTIIFPFPIYKRESLSL